MQTLLHETRRLRSLRRFELVDATAAVTWACERFDAGEAPEALERLAGETTPAESAVVDQLLDDLLEQLGGARLDDEAAGLEVSQAIAEQIVGGSREPADGARMIWWKVANRVPQLEDRLAVFVGLASEWDDNPHHRSEYDKDIIRAAHAFLSESLGNTVAE